VNQAPSSHNPERLDFVLGVLAARVNTEITTYWSRNNVLLVVNAGLLAVGFNQHSGLLAAIPLALLGITTAVIWFIVAKRARVWLRYWENKFICLEEPLPLPHMYEPFWLLAVRDGIKQGRPRPVTTLILLLPVLFIGAWIVLLIGCLVTDPAAAGAAAR
jgi:hypothetical protein